MAVIPAGYLGATVAMGVQTGPGTHEWGATGFFYFVVEADDPNDETRVFGKAYLITNKHVVDGFDQMVVKVDKPSGGARIFPVNLVRPDGSRQVVAHPDPDIDVVAVPINFAYVQDECGGSVPSFQNVDEVRLTTSGMKQKQVFEGDSVFVIGFPLQLVGNAENGPIVRGGVISRISDLLRGDSKTFLVDAEVFPGNSGGPVILRPSVMALKDTQTNDHSLLIGIVSSYMPYRDVAVSKQTGRERIIFDENSGLTVVFPVDAIEETIALHMANLPDTPSPEEGTDSKERTDEVL